MVNARVTNTVPNTRVSNTTPVDRVTSFMGGVLSPTTTRTYTLRRGMPWGILVAITRSKDLTITSTTLTTFFGEFRPVTRVVNT